MGGEEGRGGERVEERAGLKDASGKRSILTMHNFGLWRGGIYFFVFMEGVMFLMYLLLSFLSFFCLFVVV